MVIIFGKEQKKKKEKKVEKYRKVEVIWDGYKKRRIILMFSGKRKQIIGQSFFLNDYLQAMTK